MYKCLSCENFVDVCSIVCVCVCVCVCEVAMRGCINKREERC